MGGRNRALYLFNFIFLFFLKNRFRARTSSRPKPVQLVRRTRQALPGLERPRAERNQNCGSLITPLRRRLIILRNGPSPLEKRA